VRREGALCDPALTHAAADYCASKHALLGLMEALRYELDKK
jgi:short-subunit dehydrogenase